MSDFETEAWAYRRIDELEAEVQQLRGQLGEQKKMLWESANEIERLRGEVDYITSAAARREKEAQAEVERLRALNASGGAYAAAVEQNERLRAERDQARAARDAASIVDQEEGQ
jgi:peptidoglycan hydrolase CwlO-like protein